MFEDSNWGLGWIGHTPTWSSDLGGSHIWTTCLELMLSCYESKWKWDDECMIIH